MKKKLMLLIQKLQILILLFTKIEAGVLEGSVLQHNVIPLHYKIHLRLSMGNFILEPNDIFEGKVEIDLKATEDNITSITLNSDPNLTFGNVTLLYYETGTEQKLEKGEYSKENETQKFKFKMPLPKNKKSKLTINYENKFGTNRGFFRLMIKKDGNFVSYMLVTHGQPDYARMIFPCFDEPKYKATFHVVVSIPNAIHEIGYQAWSNTEIDKILKQNYKTTYIFKATPVLMSTYLVTILIAKYNSSLISKFSRSYPVKNNREFKEIRTWGDPYMLEKENIQKVHNESRKMMEIFTKKFKVSYPLEKLDQVMVSKFPFWGMENYGLIFYEGDKLQDAGIDFIRYIQAHEIAHQWFGNLVTAKEWDDFWIQEGFADYFANTIRDEMEIDGKPAGFYDFTKDLIHKSVISAFNMDSRNNLPPLSKSLKTLFEGSTAAVEATYDKATSIIRMLKLTYGTEVFDKALEYYFHFFKEKNANTTDLFHCFDLAIEKLRPDHIHQKPSKMGFEYWIKYDGYPLVNVSKYPYQPNIGAYVLTQGRYVFYDSGASSGRPATKHQWIIPITYSTSQNQSFNQTEPMLWMYPNRTTKIYIRKKVDWIVLNHQIAGFYRVLYDKSIYKEIIKVLNDKNRFHQIHELNRAQLLDDAIHFAFTNYKSRVPGFPMHHFSYLPLHLVGDLYKYLEHEDKYYPWLAAIRGVEWVIYTSCRFPYECEVGVNIFLLHTPVTKKYEELKNNPSSNSSYQDQRLRALIKRYYCENVADDFKACANTPL